VIRPRSAGRCGWRAVRAAVTDTLLRAGGRPRRPEDGPEDPCTDGGDEEHEPLPTPVATGAQSASAGHRPRTVPDLVHRCHHPGRFADPARGSDSPLSDVRRAARHPRTVDDRRAAERDVRPLMSIRRRLQRLEVAGCGKDSGTDYPPEACASSAPACPRERVEEGTR
jgi:hypothetical protein